jgi:hypothetical protein
VSEIQRRSFYQPGTPVGSCWVAACSACGTRDELGPEGRCRGCGEAFAVVPTVAIPPVKLPFWKERNVLGPACVLFGASPFLISLMVMVLSGMELALFGVLAFFAGCLSLGSVPVAYSIWQSVYPTGQTRRFSYRMPLKKAWYDITRLRGRRGLLVHVSFLAHGFVGRRIEVVVRLRGPDGHYVRASLRNYRGPYGELRARHLTDPVKHGVAAFRNLWIFTPMRALALPPGTEKVDITAEILLSSDGVVHTEHDLPISFKPLPEDFPHQLPSRGTPALPPGAPVDADTEGAIEILESAEMADVHCGVCGDLLANDVVVSCQVCGTQLHQPCWEYLGGCTTYACEGRPADAGA